MLGTSLSVGQAFVGLIRSALHVINTAKSRVDLNLANSP